MAQQKEGFQTDLLRNIPEKLHEKARKKAEMLGCSLRMYIISLLKRDLDEKRK